MMVMVKQQNFDVEKQDAVAAEKTLTRDKFVVPHSLVGMAEIHVAKSQTQEAITAVNKAKNYSGYEYSQLVSWKIKKILGEVHASDDE